METCHALRSQRGESIANPNGDEKSEHAAEKRDNKTFCEKLTNNLAAARADGGANGELSRAGGAARSKKIGQVGAGNEQDQSDGAEEQGEIGAIFPNQTFEKRRDVDRLLRVGFRIRLFQTRGDAFHFRARLIDSHARLQPPPDEQHRMNGAILPDRNDAAPEGKPGLTVLRRCHLGRHHANDGETLIVKADGTPEDIWVATKGPLPKPFVDDNGEWTTRFSFLLRKRAAQNGR